MSRHASRHLARVACLATAWALCCATAGCTAPEQDLSRVSEAAGVDVPQGRLVVDEGEHAQGRAGCAVMQLELDETQAAELEGRLAASGEWQALPATPEVSATLWGTDGTGTGAVTPAGDENFFPRVEHGWVLLRDRGEGHGGGLSMTVGLYDADARVLYLYEVDS